MYTRNTWIDRYEQRSLGDFELTPQLDQDLSIHALAAKADRHARRELFIMLATKIARFSYRYQRWIKAPWEREDVLQETWLALDDVLRAWQPLAGNGPPAGFGYYFLSVFSHRLLDRLNALTGSRRSVLSLSDQDAGSTSPDDVAGEAAANALLEQICGRLNAADADILRHRAAGLEFEPDQLRASGITFSRRTVYRRWSRIVRVAVQVLDEERAAS